MIDTTEERQETSRYNEAGFSILRLHTLWQQCERHIMKGEMQQWHFTLESIRRELHSDFLRSTRCKIFLKLDKMLRGQVLKNSNNGGGKLYLALNRRHQFLKMMQDAAGKGGSYSDGSEDDFE